MILFDFPALYRQRSRAAFSIACCIAALTGCSGEIANPDGKATARPAQSADDKPLRSQDEKALDSDDFIVQRHGQDEDAGAASDKNRDKPDADTTGCGDGLLQPGEACDDGNDKASDGCSADCKRIDRDFVCPAPGEPCVSSVVCGDTKVNGKEACDDGNNRDGDGCDRDCRLEKGYACPTPGDACQAAACGDHVIAGDEQCEDDDDPPADGDGCSAQCRLELGWVCEKAGEACRKALCNDGVKEGGEACDDGNASLGDGCTPFCEAEPDCGMGACRSRCGDGIVLPGGDEACDDGNLADGDGCSAKCQVESGFACSLEMTTPPDRIQVPVVYRDFIAVPAEGYVKHPDFEAYGGDDVTPNLVQELLSSDNKPIYNNQCDAAAAPYPDPAPGTGPCPYNQQLTDQASFFQWYRNTLGVNIAKTERIQLARNASGAYSVANSAFFPWDGDPKSWVSLGQELADAGHDYGFTSEIHTYFQYKESVKSPQTLQFSGDDDVWVFINRHLAVDIGGLHVEVARSVTLDQATASRLQLEPDKIYEVALFHAERHRESSNFNLSLSGFASAQTHCEPSCGDGIVVGRERCDDGKNDGSYGSCTKECTRAAYCGDAKRDEPQEACDDGVNITTYSATGKAGCAPGCKLSAYCGDGQVDSAAGEQCDEGKDNKGEYGKCAKGCVLGPRCGDGELQAEKGETCDDGNQVSGDGCSKRCLTESPN
jgi:fibro-slime domain-containing protein